MFKLSTTSVPKQLTHTTFAIVPKQLTQNDLIILYSNCASVHSRGNDIRADNARRESTLPLESSFGQVPYGEPVATAFLDTCVHRALQREKRGVDS